MKLLEKNKKKKLNSQRKSTMMFSTVFTLQACCVYIFVCIRFHSKLYMFFCNVRIIVMCNISEDNYIRNVTLFKITLAVI